MCDKERKELIDISEYCSRDDNGPAFIKKEILQEVISIEYFCGHPGQCMRVIFRENVVLTLKANKKTWEFLRAHCTHDLPERP